MKGTMNNRKQFLVILHLSLIGENKKRFRVMKPFYVMHTDGSEAMDEAIRLAKQMYRKVNILDSDYFNTDHIATINER